MKTLIQIVLVALIVGGMSAGGSFYWHQKLAKSATTPPEPAAATTENPAAEKSDEDGEVDHESEYHVDAEQAETVTVDESTRSHSDPNADHTEKTLSEPFGPPVGVRPPFDPNGDEAGELINRLRAKAMLTLRQERRMEEREEAMQLIMDDLRSEQLSAAQLRKRLFDETSRTIKSVDDIRRSADAERAAIYRAAQAERAKMLEEQEELKRQKEALQNPPEPVDHSGSTEETANLKDTVRRIDSMPAENTAKILQGLVRTGRTEAVVAILNSMKPRQCGSVLSLIAEEKPELAADLIDRMKRLKKETQAAAGAVK